ncbi:MAG TPA: Maf family nucleotide pyrophosphatase [Chitinophagaceae bacterium]|nr:Maf family nucleotide pyrophosphatase [Chitinophagaceae bacterium]
MNDILNTPILLISNSPRRKEILESIGFTIEIGKVEIDEIFPSNILIEEAPAYLAEKKVQAYKNKYFKEVQNKVLIGADTLVAYKEKVFEKPQNEEEAIATLKFLSGKTHQVISGYYLEYNNQAIARNCVTSVKFRELNPDWINYYVANYHPFDKAGAYGIQEWIGKVAVEEIKGDFYAVMGLPISSIMEDMSKLLKR